MARTLRRPERTGTDCYDVGRGREQVLIFGRGLSRPRLQLGARSATVRREIVVARNHAGLTYKSN